ncbi:MAG: type II secretion system protein [Dehalococcoidales bacterium]|nr:type II secretion system protein [Dehalococcoidales bacterium]
MKTLARTKTFHSQTGTSLLEILVALAILGIVAVAFLSGLATAAKASATADTQSLAESLARSEMEYVKLCAYQIDATQYQVDPALTIPAEWTVLPASVQTVHETDDGLQQITVTIQHHDNTVFVLKGYKTE